MELLVSFLGSVIFTGAISFGYGKKLTEHPAGRPILGALGFLIVLSGYSYSKRDWDLFTELVTWFIVCCSPVLVAGAILAILNTDQREVEHKQEIENTELRRYSVTGHANDRT